MRNSSATIAVLTDEYSEFRKLIVDNISRVLTNAGYGVICVAGRELDPAPRYHQDYTVCNSVYSAVQGYDIDGVVLLSGALASNSTIERLLDFARMFDHVPCVSFGLELDNIPSITFDDRTATLDLYRHVLSQRKSKKRAFVGGTQSDPYSIVREDRFRDVAQELGYSPSTHYHIQGNYSDIDTYKAVVSLLKAHPQIDVIGAANDLMAESAVRAINACQLRVPEDVMVTGFDDTKEATRVYPSITTVRQPLNEAATHCAQLLITSIEHKRNTTKPRPEQRVEFLSEMILRESTACRCLGVSQLLQTREKLIAQLSQAMSGLATPAVICFNELGSALWESGIDGSNSIELCLTRYLEQAPITVATLHWWNNACHQMEKITEHLFCETDTTGAVAAITAAIAGVRQKIWALSMNEEFERRRADSVRTTMQLQMSSCAKLIDILDTMERWLKQTEITRCYLVSYANPGPQPDNSAQLLHAYEHSKVKPVPSDRFASENILPHPYRQQVNDSLMIMTPIQAGQMLFGYLLIDPSGLDYLFLDSTAQSIGNALRNQHLIGQLEEQTQHLKSTNQELVKLANYDDLTELPNRLQFNANLKRCCEAAHAGHYGVFLMFIDLDGFKLVNDTLGHRAGDELLREVASRLKAAVDRSQGEPGFIARLGGDEFTVTVSTSGGRDHLDIIANAILDALAQPYSLNERVINISASIGMAEYLVDAQSIEALVKNADAAMYLAKDKGKNCAAWYRTDLSIVSDTFLQLDADIRMALTDGDICMHYQPRVHLDTGRIRAVEALMRWTIDTPEGPMTRTRPDIFIAVAEKTGFISQLDMFALNESCKQARLWELAGTPLLVAVNVSVHHLQQDSFVDRVLDTLSTHQLSPWLLELEITESAMMTQVDSNIEKLHQLREHGIKLSIDDFGTGYSSLSYLKQLPVNNLKIDKSFIADIDALSMRRSADAAIIKSIIALGRSMNFQIIAEGIESEQQRQFLRALGCHEAQGYLFAHPGPASDVTQLLLKGSGACAQG